MQCPACEHLETTPTAAAWKCLAAEFRWRQIEFTLDQFESRQT